MRLRSIEPRDRAFVLELNRIHEHLTAPMDESRLVELIAWADHADVIDLDGERAGFVFTFAPRTPYDSANYVEFCRLFDTFTYLDRIVISASFRRRGIGNAVYDELEALATPRMVLEVNIEPSNEPSLRFHRARGYQGVAEFPPAQQQAAKRALLMSKELERPAPPSTRG